MPIVNQTLTEREKAAIYYHVFGGCNDWRLLYAIADNTGDGTPDPKNTGNNYPSRWKHSPKVARVLDEAQHARMKLIQAAEEKGRQQGREELLDNVRTESGNASKNARIIDYTNPENQTRKLNELINTASDAGEALDALKVIIQGQKADRDAAREQKTVRAYLPVTCSGCPLYEKAAGKGGKG